MHPKRKHPDLTASVVVIDLGNTSATVGLMHRGRVIRIHRLDRKDETPTGIRIILNQVIGLHKVDGAVLASVVPDLTPRWQRALYRVARLRALEVTHHLHFGLPVTYPQPSRIGADRLANACGGAIRYGLPLIVADFGTAVTFDIITRKHGYSGGIIAPGLPLMFDYLAEKTALLPHLTLSPVKGRVGKSTKQAMQLGAQWGYRGMVREILQELRKDPDLKRAKLVATGGFARTIVAGIRPAMIIDPDLTLFGLGCIDAFNNSRLHRS